MLFGRGVVISGVGIGDRVPYFLNGRVGADNHLVTGPSNGVSVVSREGEGALWGFRVIVKGLGEGVVKRRLIGAAVEEGAGAEYVETFGKTRLHGEGPVVIRLTKGRSSRVVVVREMLDGRRVKISHTECGEHFLFVGDCRFASRPPRGCSISILVFEETDLVAEGGAARGFGNAVCRPPIFARNTTLVIQLGDPRRSPADSTRTLRETSIEGVVNKRLEAATNRVAFRPNGDVGSGFVKLWGLRSRSPDGGCGIVIDK